MTRFGWIVASGVAGIILIACGVFIWHHARTEAPVDATQQATSTPPADLSTLSIYTSGEYGFSLFYPSSGTLTDAYTADPLTGMAWRMGALATGTPVVRITDRGEEVRVGVSMAQKEVASCLTAGPAESAQGSVKIGTSTWQSFQFQKVGPDNQPRVTSYRTMHDSACYALELFQPLTASASTTGYTLGDTLTSFTFAD